jgi:hypothetical protein
VSAEGPERAAPDPKRAALERRYRRLLRCYPPGHRAAHQEEMLGVLLAAARPGQRAPGARQTVNLVACGLAIRARRALAAGPWQDALAVASLILPVLMLIIAALGLAVAVRQEVAIDAYPPGIPFWRLGLVPDLGEPAAVLAGWLAVVLLGLTGRRRTAATIASALLALALVNPLAEVVHLTGDGYLTVPLFFDISSVSPVVLASLAACSLAFSAGPDRGLAITGRRRASLMIAGLSVVFGYSAVVYLVSPSASWDGSGFLVLDVLTIAVAAVVTRVPGTVGWRVAVLVTVPMLLLDVVSIVFGGSGAAILVPLLGTLLFALLMWPVAIASWRGRSSPAAAG